MKKVISFLSVCILFINAYPQLYRQNCTNFTRNEVGKYYSGNTQAITEDENGLIYIGIPYQILQFDGYNWRSIPVKAGVYVTSLACHNNIVYVGTYGDFGYLESSTTGKYSYRSLLHLIKDKNDTSFTSIWKTLIYGENIVFQSPEKIFIYNGKEIKVINAEMGFHLAFVCKDQLFVCDRFSGLLLVTDKGFQPVTGGEIFADTLVFSVLPYKENSSLVLTQEKEMYKLDNNEVSPVIIEDDLKKLLYESIVYGGIYLTDGNYAIYTRKNGIIILDKDLNLVTNYNLQSGMRSAEINDLKQDRFGNLWSATMRGVNRIQYSSPISVYNEYSGLQGNVYCVAKFNTLYYAGTSEGLFVCNSDGGNSFSEVKEVTGSIWSVITDQNGLWIGAKSGLWYFDGSRFSLISKGEYKELLFISEQNWMIASSTSGIQIYNSNNRSLIKNLPETGMNAMGSAYRKKGSDKYEIWFGSDISGVLQIEISTDLQTEITTYNTNDGLKYSWVNVFQYGESILFGTNEGMLKFISKEELFAELNDPGADISLLKGYFDSFDYPLNSITKAITAYLHDLTEPVVAMNNMLFDIDLKSGTPDSSKYNTLDIGRLNKIYKTPGQLLICSDDAIAAIHIDKNDSLFSAKPLILLREIIIGQDSVIWSGDTNYHGNLIEIAYRDNSIKFNFSSLYFFNGKRMKFSWKLDEGDMDFSEWSDLNIISLSNLREGDYTLRVKGKNVHNIESDEIIIRFTILSPWYLTWWAYIIYGIVGLALIYLIIQLNLKRLKAQNKKLEEIVTIRTKEVVAQKEEIELQKETIEEILKDLNDSIFYAQRIQEAVLPGKELISTYFPDNFILFMPRNIVSGDFYWATKVNEWLIITAADCTGHGVPGAFMSMLGISFLNEIVRKKEIVNPAKVLDNLRFAIIEALKQTGGSGTQKDGMDISLCAINTETKICNWAGANNPLWIIRSENVNKQCEDSADRVEEIKADKMPVAIHISMNDFTFHELKLNPGDRIYMFSDGYPDQFGGPKEKKFMYKAFRRMLGENAHKPMAEQIEILKTAYNNWTNWEDKRYEQVDDITVIGICI